MKPQLLYMYVVEQLADCIAVYTVADKPVRDAMKLNRMIRGKLCSIAWSRSSSGSGLVLDQELISYSTHVVGATTVQPDLK